jgi:ABC-type bacteriocin/lantibiotic exporter with double-glycine peptidase domain
MDPALSLAALAPVPVAMVIAHASGRWVAARTARTREANAALTARIQELLAGYRVLRFFGRAVAATHAVSDLSDAYAGRNLSAMRLRLGLPALYSTLMMSGILVVVWQGGERVVSGAMTVGAFVAYLALFTRFAERAFRIPQLVNSIQAGGAAYARLDPMIAPPLPASRESRFASFRSGHIAGIAHDEAPAGRDRSGPIAATLERVTFTYPGAARPALVDLSLDVEPGSFVAVTGPVGSGKSALARVLLGIYPIDSGTIRLSPADGTSVRHGPGLVGYLPQHPQLFSGSIEENVLMRAGASSPEHLTRSIEVAALDVDLALFPEGVRTQVGELGVALRG